MSSPKTGQKSDASSLEARTSFSGDMVQANTLSEYLSAYRRKVTAGDIGALPAILGLIVLVIFFIIVRPDTFPTALNFANLLQQAGAICVLAMGIGFVLLLGHIDLSAGVIGGVGAATMASFMAKNNWPWVPGVLAAIVVGVLMGLLTGFLVTAIGIPSFVVTLAFFLAWQGLLLWVVGESGPITVANPTILAIENKNVPVTAGWIVVVLSILAYGAVEVGIWSRRNSQKLVNKPLSVVLARVAAIGVLLLLVTWFLSLNRALSTSRVTLAGIPWVVPLLAVLLIIWTFVQNRTAFGRYVYAVGGNAEAARRAGIRVSRITIACFVISSVMAVLSGIITASRGTGVPPDAGTHNELLYAVAAAVIGGTSLFGGKGRARDAIIGGLVIAVIANGLGLIVQDAKVNYMVTGGVLLIAAAVDALTRRRRASAGR